MSRNQKGFTLIELLIVLAIIGILFFALFRGTFVDADVATRSLEKQGYENIQILEKDWFLVGVRGCGQQDAAKFVVRATNPAKKTVEVNVCVGWPFKGATIRTD